MTVSTALPVAAATWGMFMALSPLLQLREIRRRRSSEGISIGYFAVWTISATFINGLRRGCSPTESERQTSRCRPIRRVADLKAPLV